jgi:hypothetical protein
LFSVGKRNCLAPSPAPPFSRFHAEKAARFNKLHVRKRTYAAEQMPMALYAPPPSFSACVIIALVAAAYFNAAAAVSPVPSPSEPDVSSDARASVEQDVSQWIPWFDFGVSALSANIPLLASRAFLISARLSGNPAAWSNAGFALTKMKGSPHPRMLDHFAAAFRGSRDDSAAVFLAQAMIMLGMHKRALDFTSLFLTRRCGRSSSNCVWRNGKPKIIMHSGAAADAAPDMCGCLRCVLTGRRQHAPQVHHFVVRGRRQRRGVLVRHAAANLQPLGNAAARPSVLPQVNFTCHR